MVLSITVYDYKYVMFIVPDGAPENVTGSATSSTSIRLTWDTPAQNLQNGYIVEYRVRVTEKNTGTVSTSTVIEKYLILTFLHPYYIYSCSVAAVTVGIGPYSIAINITTDEDGETLHMYIYSYLTVLYPHYSSNWTTTEFYSITIFSIYGRPILVTSPR